MFTNIWNGSSMPATRRHMSHELHPSATTSTTGPPSCTMMICTTRMASQTQMNHGFLWIPENTLYSPLGMRQHSMCTRDSSMRRLNTTVVLKSSCSTLSEMSRFFASLGSSSEYSGKNLATSVNVTRVASWYTECAAMLRTSSGVKRVSLSPVGGRRSRRSLASSEDSAMAARASCTMLVQRDMMTLSGSVRMWKNVSTHR
mmetsp:Transcript_5026/g.17532  ORF Transcript_5026/g.17532 Transcript_5026/m.17532 type:complete len:201 (+) Transcript_5026:286-888(+)